MDILIKGLATWPPSDMGVNGFAELVAYPYCANEGRNGGKHWRTELIEVGGTLRTLVTIQITPILYRV